MSARRRRALLLAAALTVGTLAAAGPSGSAPGDPAFQSNGLEPDVAIETQTSSCSHNPPSQPVQPTTPLAENSAPVNVTVDGTATVNHTGGTGVTTTTLHLTGTATAASAGGVFRSADLSATSAVSSSTPSGDTWCVTQTEATISSFVHLNLSVAGYLEVRVSGTGPGPHASVQLTPGIFGVVLTDVVRGTPGSGTRRLFLPAGEYSGPMTVGVDWDTRGTMSGTSTASVHLGFTPAGTQTAAQSGKGAKYATMTATARSCASHTVAASVTSTKARAKKIKSVTAFVGDHKVLTDKHVKAGEAYALAVADDQPAPVRLAVTLKPKKHGHKKPKVLETTASYEACS